MAMVIMVKNIKNVGMTDYDPEVQHTNILYMESLENRKRH